MQYTVYIWIYAVGTYVVCISIAEICYSNELIKYHYTLSASYRWHVPTFPHYEPAATATGS